MKKEKFKTLLEDLYNLYNREHLIYVDSLVDKYHEMPYSAVEMILLKYNHPTFSHYDPKRSTDEYKIELINKYASGERPLQNLNLEVEAKKNKEIELEQKVIVPKRLEDGIGELENRLSQIENKLSEDVVEYTVIVNNNEKEGDPILPNKKQLASLGCGSRMVVALSNNTIAGYTIKDIIYDSVSLPDKISVTIFIERS